MNLFETLKHFKTIEPDPVFREKSKRAILTTHQKMGIGFGILQFLETGVAVVLTGFFILLITGGFAGQQLLAPVQYSVIDPQGLRAEAQAIDMQIELANVNYAEVTATTTVGTTAESTPPLAPVKSLVPLMVAASSSVSSSLASGAPASSTDSSSTLSIDQALEQLSK